MLSRCLHSSIWPGNRERTRQLQQQIGFGERGSSLKSGFDHKFSLHWLFCTYDGLINLEIYFWLVKDMAWSQLNWFYLGMVFGILTLVLNIFLILSAVYYKIYSEALIGFGTLLWLTANFIWMVGEIWDGPDSFYDDMTEVAQYVSLATVIYLVLVVLVLPFFYYDENRLQLLEENIPRHHFGLFVRDYIELDNLHILFWSIKDSFWLFEVYNGYVVTFVVSVSLLIDSIYLTVTTKYTIVELSNLYLILLWMLSNLLWATSELVVEDEDSDFDNYFFMNLDLASTFYLRYASGMVYLFSVLCVALFYYYWVFRATIAHTAETKQTEEVPLTHYELTVT